MKPEKSTEETIWSAAKAAIFAGLVVVYGSLVVGCVVVIFKVVAGAAIVN